MSAVQPADPARLRTLSDVGPADVIDISARHTTRGARTAARGRWKTMTTGHAGHNRSPLELVADDVEKWLNSIDRTLTDEETALVYRRTLEVVVHVLKGAEAQGIISEDQREQLGELLEALERSPDLL